MTNHGCFGRFAKCKIIGTFCRLSMDCFPLLVLEPIISKLLVGTNLRRQECLVLARCLYTAVSVWLRLLPSGSSGVWLVGEQGTLTGAELVAGEILGAGVGTGAG